MLFAIHSSDKEKFKLPKTLDDAKELGRVLSNYKDDFFLQVVFGFMVVYILYPFHQEEFLSDPFDEENSQI